MLRISILFSLLLFSVSSLAQQEIKGTIYDKNTRSPLSGASVTIYSADKSVVKGQAITDRNGQFSIANPPSGNYNLIISFLGYQANRIPIIVSGNSKVYNLDMKQTGLAPNSIKLNTINIKGNKPLIAIRKDTIEFSSDDFFTAENANLKNLLQKIPGVTVGRDGSFYFQGKKINDLYIDGRPAFSNGANGSGDPKELAMLLQSNTVDKVQFADKRGVDGIVPPGTSEKVINITIKKEAKKGVNGKIGGGYGTDGRYTGNVNVNAFRNKMLMMGMGSANNTGILTPIGVNDESISLPPLPGFNTMRSLGATTSFNASSDSKISINARAGQIDNEIQTLTDRTNILPDSSFKYLNNTANHSKSNIGSAGITLDQKLNQTASLNINFYGSLSHENKETNTSFSTTGKTTADKINAGNTSNNSVADKNRYSFSIFYNQAFKKAGRNLFVNYIVIHEGNVEDQKNYTLNQLFQFGTADTTNQKIHLKTTSNTVMFGPTYKEPLSEAVSLNVSYTVNNTITRNEQYTSDFDTHTMLYSKENNDLSYIFKNSMLNHRFASGITYSKNKLSANLSLDYSITKSDSRNYMNNQYLEQNINYWSPNLGITYRIDNFKTFTINFGRGVDFPRMESLIPVVSTTNPLYVKLGNPDLKPGAKNSFNLEYTSIGIKGVMFSIRSISDLTSNGIGNAVYSDSIGRQITKPVNVNGNFDSRLIMGIGKRFEKISLTINYSLESQANRNTNYINYQKNTTSNYQANNLIAFNWNFKKLIESNLMFDWSYNGSHYSIQNSYFDYTSYGCNLATTFYLPLQINTGASFSFSHNTAQRESNSLLNAWIAKTWLSDKSLLTKFNCFDLLKKYKSFSTQQTATFVEQINNNNITQYFMGSVTWFFGKKKPGQQ